MEDAKKTPPISAAAEVSKTFDVRGMSSPKQHAWASTLAKIIYRDLNDSTKAESFTKYTKEQIATFIKDPVSNEQQLRDAVKMLYNISPHFWRLVQYMAQLCDLSYVISQNTFDGSGDDDSLDKFQRTAVFLAGSDIAAQSERILTTCFREDVCYCTAWVTREGMSFQILDPNYCKIASYEKNCWNVAYDFSYFDMYSDELELFPKEFQSKYAEYQRDTNNKWIELDSPNSFAIKANDDLTYVLPPFVGILRAIYDIEDYKDLSLTSAEKEIYSLLVMKLGLNKNGEWLMDFNKAKEFWMNLDAVLPTNFGSVLSPMDIDKITFEPTAAAQRDKVVESEQHLWDAAGVSSLIFSGSSTSSRALEISGMADESLTWGIVQRIGIAINRILKKQSFAKNYCLVFLPCGRYTRDRYQDSLKSVLQYGLPVVTPLLATMGFEPLYAVGLNHIENNVLKLNERLIPLQSSNTISSKEQGRPQSDTVSDEGERSRDKR